MDKRARFALERLVDEFTQGRSGRIYHDLEGPAVYRLEDGAECSAVACLACRTVTLKPGVPRKPTTTLPCSSCGVALELHPPLEVVSFGQYGIRPATALPAPH